jgi:hypothetical protein
MRTAVCLLFIAVFGACVDAEPDPMAPHDESRIESALDTDTDTLEKYAAKCDFETGTTVPDFDCDAGTLVPTEHHDPATGKCDQPNRLNQKCDPGSRFQVLSESPTAYVVAHCRKKGLAAGRYGDIAVIQHNRTNGATCFYQALGDLDGKVKAPSKGTSAWPWYSPRQTADIGCAGCHDNGPLVRSPYLTRLKELGLPNPLPGSGDYTWNRTEPYRFVGLDFRFWRVHKVEVAGNTCNGCHRMGTNNVRPDLGTSLDLGMRATAESETNKNPHSPTSRIWMTPGSIYYSAANRAAAQAIHDCAAAFQAGGPLPAGCNVTDYTGSYSTPDSLPPVDFTLEKILDDSGWSARVHFKTTDTPYTKEVRLYTTAVPSGYSRPMRTYTAGGAVDVLDTDLFANTTYTYRACTVSDLYREQCVQGSISTATPGRSCPTGKVYCYGSCKDPWLCEDPW